MVRIGIVGVGFMGRIHYLAAQKLTGAKVAAVCSRDPAKLAGDWRNTRGNFGPEPGMVDLSGVGKKFANAAELFADPDIDLIDICTVTDQHAPLAIRFRFDEKRFDVDGAYNVRYEIMKKRIDKAVLRGTTERLTQPGKIALVYSQPAEAAEYKQYIAYLQSLRFLTPEVEYLELDELQGVTGLRALRVTVDLVNAPVQPGSSLMSAAAAARLPR